MKENKPVPKELTEQIQLDEADLKKPVKNEGYTVEIDQFEGLIAVCELEIVARSLKHVLREQGKLLPSSVLAPHLIAYFLNLLFGKDYNEEVTVENLDPFFSSQDLVFTKFNRELLAEEILKQAKTRFRYDLSAGWLSEYEHKFSKFALIRAIAEKFGIQLINKEYFFTKEQYQNWKQSQDKKLRSKLVDPKQTFSINDFSLRPIVKGSDFQSLIAEELWMQGATLINEVSKEQEDQRQKKASSEENDASENDDVKDDQNDEKNKELEKKMTEALSLMGQSIAFREDIFGLVHPSLVSSYLLLSTMYSRLGHQAQAITFCNKAALLSERCFGVDSFETVRILTNLAYLEFGQGSINNSALVLKKVHELLKLLAPSVHSGRVNIFNLFYQIASSIDDKKLEIKILNKFSELLVKITGGEETLPYGQNQSRLANLYASTDDMKHALEHIIKAKGIFSTELGLNDETTANSKQWIETIQSIIAKQQQEKKAKLGHQKTLTTPPSSQNGKKTVASNPDLANKSVDELLRFIEGESSATKGKTSKKSKKKHGKN